MKLVIAIIQPDSLNAVHQALIDAEIKDFKDGPCSQGQKFSGACPEGAQDLSGGDLPNSPDWIRRNAWRFSAITYRATSTTTSPSRAFLLPNRAILPTAGSTPSP